MAFSKQEEFILKSCTQVQQVCSSFLERFSLAGFTFQRMYKSGERIYLTNSSDWAENFIRKRYLLVSGWKKFSYLQSCTLWKCWPKDDESFHALMKDARDNFNYGNGLVINKFNNEFLDAFTFRSTEQNEEINNTYLSSFDSFEKFTNQFVKDQAALIEGAKKNAITIQESRIKIPYNKELFKQDIETNAIHTKHSELPIKNIILNVGDQKINLSTRESECAINLAKGNTTKGIAKIMKIHPRTVETYINNIKNKINCRFKDELIHKILEERDNVDLIFYERTHNKL